MIPEAPSMSLPEFSGGTGTQIDLGLMFSFQKGRGRKEVVCPKYVRNLVENLSICSSSWTGSWGPEPQVALAIPVSFFFSLTFKIS